MGIWGSFSEPSLNLHLIPQTMATPLKGCKLLLYHFRMFTAVTVKCCTVVSALTVALFTGPSLSSQSLDSDPSMSRDDRRSAEGLGRDSSSDSENEDKSSQRPGKDQAILKVDEWISLTGRNEVRGKPSCFRDLITISRTVHIYKASPAVLQAPCTELKSNVTRRSHST